MPSMVGASGVSICNLESMSRVTSPETPKAVVWYRLGKVILAHLRTSIGWRLLRVLFRNLRCCLVRMTEGRAPLEDAPEAYPDS